MVLLKKNSTLQSYLTVCSEYILFITLKEYEIYSYIVLKVIMIIYVLMNIK